MLLGCVSGNEFVVTGTPGITGSSTAEEIAPGTHLTQTSMSPSSTPPTGCSNPQADARVEIISDKLTYRRGETILVTICNYLPDVIFAPPQGGCSVVTVQRLENNRWVTEGSCPEQEVHVFRIPPRSQMTQVLWPISQAAANQGAVTSEPIPPDVFEGNLQDLPTSTPFPFPVIEVPEGAIAPPFSLLETDLPAGTYRIEFSFTVGHPAGASQATYSADFVVIG
jgi:hypothetical protein